MLQNISHELKTPVMVIRSYSEGLGMAIVKYIVEFHKGEIYAINENGGVIKIPA
ncbi:histidine kinase dimerization/phospho-acceptor domain-containing protein [Clostridium estertheticum]|uniref:histidine kinase dimerization/phospho-acceptor domain-containing protein n=1 Tax=Clostridium estertheticum TaxID=238834 RepID=UPI0013E9682A|nr:histidine kinase dimerization/phospho-acceptor domain-containing protein [Clostridium estertheticum]